MRIPRGGCGNEFMLIVFRTVFPAEFTPGVLLCFCSVLDPASNPLEGARSPLLGRGVERPCESTGVGMPPVLLRVFCDGMGGNADVGGPMDGRDDRGNDVAIAYVCVERW